MSAAVDAVGVALRIAMALAGPIQDAVTSGSTEEALTASLVLATHVVGATARARIDARAGHATDPRLVEAVHQDDAVIRLTALGLPVMAAEAREMAHKLRAAVAATADTEPPA